MKVNIWPPLSTYQGEKHVRRGKISSDSFGRAKFEVLTSAKPPFLNTEKKKENEKLKMHILSSVFILDGITLS